MDNRRELRDKAPQGTGQAEGAGWGRMGLRVYLGIVIVACVLALIQSRQHTLNDARKRRGAVGALATVSIIALVIDHEHLTPAADSQRQGSQIEPQGPVPATGLAPPPVTETSAGATVKASSAGRWAICVTGQLSRLELESKLVNLITPLSEVASAVDVFVVLDKAAGAAGLSPFKSFEQVTGFLRRFTGPGRPVAQVRVLHKALPKAPLANPDYVERLRGTSRLAMGKEGQRATSQVQEWYHLTQCMQAIRAAETKLRVTYRGAIRLREDMRIITRADIGRALRRLHPRAVLTAPCAPAETGGVDDKIALVGQVAMSAYFEAPLLDYYLKPTVALQEVNNHDKYLERTLLRNKALLRPLVGITAVPQVFLDNSRGFCLQVAAAKPGSAEFAERAGCLSQQTDALTVLAGQALSALLKDLAC